jgi:hypothetical protein
MQKIKNPVPFYTLKEASKELNRVLQTDYYDWKMLLRLAFTHDLKLYFYTQGWKGHHIIDVEFTSEYSAQLEDTNDMSEYYELHGRKDATLNAIAKEMSLDLVSGCLIELTTEIIRQFQISKTQIFETNNINHFELLLLPDAISTDVSHNPIKELNFKEKLPSFLDFDYEDSIDRKTLESIVNLKIVAIKLEKPDQVMDFPAIPKPNDPVFIPEENEEIFSYVIHRKDILISHYQLTRIINQALNIRDKPHDNNKEKILEAPKKPQGKSDEKKAAQNAAKEIAKKQWEMDKEQKIRIGEMCEIVWGILYESEHQPELPDKPECLKKWIRDIAPEYASKKGRPKCN